MVEKTALESANKASFEWKTNIHCGENLSFMDFAFHLKNN